MLSVTENTSQGQSDDPFVYRLTTGLLSDEMFLVISLVLLFILQIINTIGLICNSLSIAVFVKLGYSEPSNISLTALAISDLVSIVLSLWTNLCFLLTFRDTILPFHASNVSFLTGSSPFAYVIRTVAWITAFISFERCLCILVPLKVKRLITARSTCEKFLFGDYRPRQLKVSWNKHLEKKPHQVRLLSRTEFRRKRNV
ncbi:chemosensory receptor b [Plakobranchus ocellatus]|uniref:Chemosensory receptor b n=1 Tax=Plakobranchus ocellatus TaxID=259542 RepID=A0AAV4DGJ4_9GAST|nr:chemosensory receptor b [Plakobranchus ocellatus]